MTSTTAEPGQKPERGKGTAVKGKPSGNENALGNGLIIFLTILSIRIVNALTIRTFFQPDEYFQALEPAWNLAFAGGRGWVTWEWKEQLRSIAHPLLFTGVYKATDFLSSLLSLSDSNKGELLLVAPRVFQGVFAALGDYWTFELGKKLLRSEEGAWLSLAFSVGSAFNWFCSTRTFSNSLETSLTAGAMAYWLWPGESFSSRRLTASLSLAALACILRPTNVMIWASLGGLLMARLNEVERLTTVTVVALVGSTALLLNFALDYWFYGMPAFPPLKFLTFNLVQSLSVFYGRMPWHYYLSQGLPLLLTTFLPLTIHEICNIFESTATAFEAAALSGAPPEGATLATGKFQISLTTVFVIITYSCISHKEMRFLYPMVPALHVLAADSLCGFNLSKTTRKRIAAGLIILNIPVAWYATQVHQRGVIDVVDWLRRDRDNFKTVGFMMPCHSTPWQSHLQLRDDQVGWALTCEPPLNVAMEEREAYLDEADIFYLSPAKFFKTHFPPPPKYSAEAPDSKTISPDSKYNWPDRLVAFEHLEKTGLKEWMGGAESRYHECARFFNSHFHDDSRRVGDVVVYCMNRGKRLMKEEDDDF